MANKIIQLTDGTDNLYPATGKSSANYTPTITAGTGFTYDSVNFLYKLTADFLWIAGRFRVVNHGSTASVINISYPTGVTTIAGGVGAFGQVAVNNSTNSSALSVRPNNSGNGCFIQSGAGNTTVSSIIPNGEYVVMNALIPRT